MARTAAASAKAPRPESAAKECATSAKMPRDVGHYTVEFGAISIPTTLYTAAREEKIERHQFHSKCNGQIKQLGNFCPVCSGAPEPESIDPAVALQDVRLGKDDIFKGVEVGGKIVEITDAEIKEREPESAKVLNVQEFVSDSDIDPIYLECSYYLAPDVKAGALRGYAILRAAMLAEGKVAVAKIVRNKREHLALIRPYGTNGMMVFTTYLADEVRPMMFPELPPYKDAELKVARQLVDVLSAEWEPTKYRDEYRVAVAALIDAKVNDAEPPKAERKPSVSVSDDPLTQFAATLELIKKNKSSARKSA